MTDDDARQWLVDHLNVSRETIAVLGRYVECVRSGSKNSNLVSRNSLATFWERHIVDSAQLVVLAGTKCDGAQRWVDVGSGAGIPGIVTAILTRQPTMLIEPRGLRARFLTETVDALGLRNVVVVPNKAQDCRGGPFSVLTARAVAALPELVKMSHHLSDRRTLWLLPKGRSALGELASLPVACQGDWRIEPSVTEFQSGILVGRRVESDRYI